MKIVENFIQKAREQGYVISGSVFKVDYNGKTYRVGFWIRPTFYNHEKGVYELPGLIGTGRDKNLTKAIKLAIAECENRNT